MGARSVRILVISAAFLAGLVLCLGVVLMVFGRVSAPVAQQFAAVGGPFKLTDQNGQALSEQDLKGRPFLVFFGFTHCPDVCPTTLFEVSEILRSLGHDADRTRALFITVDPERDTPPVMKDYLSSFDPHLAGLTGDPAAIAAVAKAYRVYTRRCLWIRAAIPWTIPPLSILWTRRVASLCPSISSGRPKLQPPICAGICEVGGAGSTASQGYRIRATLERQTRSAPSLNTVARLGTR
jgi:protein SCO1